VHGVDAVHLMQHAREAQWQTPVTDTPHLLLVAQLKADVQLASLRRILAW
jgi:hypothetical protein